MVDAKLRVEFKRGNVMAYGGMSLWAESSAQITHWRLHFLGWLAQISAEVGDLAGVHAHLGTAEQAAQGAGNLHLLVSICSAVGTYS